MRLHNVGMRYDQDSEVLHDINIEFPRGSFHYLCGPSGAGKSSLLKLLYLAHLPSSGRVLLDGEDTRKIPVYYLPYIRQKIGVVFQDFCLIPSMTVFDNVALSARIYGTPEPQVKRETAEMLSWVGLQDHLMDYPLQLSGGQQQRLAIARAVINRPDIMIADEPTGNVDEGNAYRIMCLFDEMHRQGTTVIVATHNTQVMALFPHKVLEIHQGKLQRGVPR